MLEAIPDYYYGKESYILLNERSIASIRLVLTNEKILKNKICWEVSMNSGEKWVIKESERLEELMPR